MILMPDEDISDEPYLSENDVDRVLVTVTHMETYPTYRVGVSVDIFGVMFGDLHLPHYQWLLTYYIFSDLHSLCSNLHSLHRTKQIIVTYVLFWKSVEIYISTDICVTEKKM